MKLGAGHARGEFDVVEKNVGQGLQCLCLQQRVRETEMGQGIARSFWRDDPKNFNILKHNPCESEFLDIVKTSIIKKEIIQEEIINSEISKLRSILEKKATIEDNLVNLEAAKKQKQ